MCVLSCIRLFGTPWTVALQAPLSTGILQAGILERVAAALPPGDLPTQGSNPGIEPRSLALQADYLPSEPPGKPSLTSAFSNRQSGAVGNAVTLWKFSITTSLKHDLKDTSYSKGLRSCRNHLSSRNGASLVAETVKNLPVMQETPVRSLGCEDPLKKGMATHFRILAWESHGQRSLVRM